MIEASTIKRIEEFVHAKPRSVHEIAIHLKKNWRTVDRYVQQVEEEYGSIATRVFREGTRGALKIVYANAPEQVSKGKFQEDLERQITSGRRKEDFSAFDIFQYVDAKKKNVVVYKGTSKKGKGRLKTYSELLNKAKKEVFFFSGNLSFITYREGNLTVMQILDKLIKKGIRIKVVCRVELDTLSNLEALLSLNHLHGREAIEVRHNIQPLRATIIDGKVIDLQEIKSPTGKPKELTQDHLFYYTVQDEDWAAWLTRIFWKLFNGSVGSAKRVEELKKCIRG